MRKSIFIGIVALILAFAMLGIRRIDSLDDQVQFKKIELKDNTVRLKLLDSKYDLLNKQLDKTGTDKTQIEQQLNEVQKERDQLKKDLQAKVDAKNKAIAQATLGAVGHTASAESLSGAKAYIYSHESGNNPGAINASSGACGLGQALPCSKMPCNLSDYACQDTFFTTYMISRYGSWENAQAFWIANHYW